MVRIRLSRAGRKNAPAYRIVVIDRKSKRDGQYIELIGHYNPTEDPNKLTLKQDRYDYWLSVGGQPSSAIIKLIAGNYKYTPYNPRAKKEEVAEVAPEAPEAQADTGTEEAAAE